MAIQVLDKIFAFIIEGFFMAGAGLSILGIRLKFKKMLHIAGIYGIIVYAVRKFYIINEIPFGTHIFILCVSFALLIKTIGKQNIMVSFIASLFSILLIFWGEGVFLFPILKFFEINPQTLTLKHGGTILAILISDIILIAVFLMSYIFKVRIIDLGSFKETKN